MKKILVGLFCVVFALPAVTMAADFRASDNGDTQSVAKAEKVKNLYTAGNLVNVDATVKGDLVAGGSTVNVTGSVEQGLLAAGSSLNLKGDVGQNARATGANIILDGKVAQDFLAAGGTIDLSKTSVVSGDVMVAGGQINLNGTVGGRVWTAGGIVSINGTINGDVVIKGANQVNIGSDAVIKGSLTYDSPKEASIASGAKVLGQTSYHKTEQNKTDYKLGQKAITGFSLYTALMSFLVLLALVYLFPKTGARFVESSLKSFWANLGWGFLTFAVAPTAIILLLFTLLGAKILGGAYLFALMIAVTASSVLIGTLIMYWFTKKYQLDWLTVLVGMVAWTLLNLIPFLGWLITGAFTLVALGRMSVKFFSFAKSQRG